MRARGKKGLAPAGFAVTVALLASLPKPLRVLALRVTINWRGRLAPADRLTPIGAAAPLGVIFSLCVVALWHGCAPALKDRWSPQFATQIGSPTARLRGRFAVLDRRRRSPCRETPVTQREGEPDAHRIV